MKMLYKNPLFLSALLLSFASSLKGQTNFYGELQGNDIRARFNATGQLFWDGKSGVFQTPKGSGLSTLSASSLWIGALDDQGNLHLGAQTYRESGADFWPGPLKVTDGTTSTAVSEDYNKVWHISRLQIDSFKAGLSIPNAILNWPGNGNSADGYAQKLAPFVDLNSNGIYEPANGEYPDIKGDEMLWWVFNDNLAVHTESDGARLGVEVQASAYIFSCSTDPILRNTVFVDYKIINRSANTYNNAYIGLWSDIDIGNLFDDRIGSDPALQLYYGYNGNAADRDTMLTAGNDTFSYKGFGQKLPAQGVLFPGGLTGPGGAYAMSGFIYYNNNNSDTVSGNPTKPAHYYNLLRSRWLNGQHLTEGGDGSNGSTPTAFAFPGDIRTKTGWTDLVNTPGDRRGLGAFGPFSMSTGDEFTLSTAYIFAQSPSGFTPHSAALVKNQARTVGPLYRKNALQACTGIGFCQTGDTCVFPGDADRDGKAFMYDVFNMGYAFGETGPKRALASSAWVGQPAASWGRTFPDGTDYRHADANGDGVIDSADILPIVLNYGLTHMKDGQRSGTAADPVLKINLVEDTVIAGTEMTAEISLGTEQLPAENVFGVAFRVAFEPAILEQGSFVLDVTDSELGTKDDLVIMQRHDPIGGTVDFGLVRTNKFVKDIKGLMLRWKYVIDPVVVGNKKSHAKMEIVEVVDSNLNIIPVTTENDEVYVLSAGSGIRSKAVGTRFSLYPNPATHHIYMQLPVQARQSGMVNIYTMQGTLIQYLETKPGDNKIHLDIQNLPDGMYLVELITAEGRTVQRFIKN